MHYTGWVVETLPTAFKHRICDNYTILPFCCRIDIVKRIFMYKQMKYQTWIRISELLIDKDKC